MEAILRTQKPSFRDPAFMENKFAPIHRWVPWIAGFSGQFVNDVFREFLSGNKTRSPLVLDPFAGVGTTLVEAMLHGYETMGFEINPYASLAAKAKLQAVTISLDRVYALINRIRREAQCWNGGPLPTHYRPSGFRSRIPFFSKKVEPQVLRVLEFLDTYPDQPVATLGKVALGAVLVRVSNYTYEPSLSSRPGAGKPLVEDADVPGILVVKLREMLADIAWLQSQCAGVADTNRREVFTKDFLAINGELPNNSVHLMITSPPYMNNYHYVRNTRPHLFWLSLINSPKDLHQIENQNFGKFWQTVRDADPIPIRFEHPQMSRVISRLRETREEAGAYGGPGWSNYVTSYFNDCDRFAQILRRVLRRGGIGVVVIGNSIIQGINIATDRILGDLVESHGLKVRRIVRLRQKRVGASITGSSVRRGKRNPAALYESAVIFQNP